VRPFWLLTSAKRNPAERIGRASFVLEVEDPQAHRGGFPSALTPPSSEVSLRTVECDVTFLMGFDGFDPAFGFVNGMVIVDSLALFNRLLAESAGSLVTVRLMMYLRHWKVIPFSRVSARVKIEGQAFTASGLLRLWVELLLL
jgi:hypothetical protein